jgi:hypothetical protein
MLLETFLSVRALVALAFLDRDLVDTPINSGPGGLG